MIIQLEEGRTKRVLKHSQSYLTRYQLLQHDKKGLVMDVLQLITLICQRKTASCPTSFSAARIFLVIYSGGKWDFSTTDVKYFSKWIRAVRPGFESQQEQGLITLFATVADKL